MSRGIFIALIDFDSACLWQDFYAKREPKYLDVEDALEEIIVAISDIADIHAAPAKEIWIRIYGGWHSRVEGTTSLYNWIEKARDHMPLRKCGRVVRIETVRGLHGFPGLYFEESLDVWKGLGKARKTKPYLCLDEPCQFWTTIKKNGKKCPKDGCSLSANDLFENIGQKTVDTSLSIDAVNLAMAEDDSWIAIFSSDYDLVPACIAASYHSHKILRLHRSGKPPKLFGKQLLAEYGITDVEIS